MMPSARSEIFQSNPDEYNQNGYTDKYDTETLRPEVKTEE